ncbi:MFS transporter [Solirubrobacter taibaiensis]|nr:MFS transporter [Solirubrobacter taibaiensis]
MTRDLRLLSAAIALSAAGDMLLNVVLALRVHELTGSGFAVAGLFAALMVPVVVLSPWAGRLVDRVETRRVLLLVSLVQVAVAGALVFADGVASILALTALLGATAAVASPAEAALVPAAAAGGDDLTKANGWVETARYIGFTAGPLLAGVLIAAGGTSLGLIANAVSFGVVALAALLLRARREPSATARADAGGGLALLLGDGVLRAALVPAVAALLFITASLTVEVFYVRDVVGAGPAGYSLVIAGWTAGMVLGAVAFARRITAPLAIAALIALAIQGGGMAASALWAVLPWAFAGYFVGGVGHGVKNVLLRTLIQRRVPEEAHGRAFAAYGAARNTAELGALAAGGLLVGVLGAQPALFLAGLAPVIAAAIGLAFLKVPGTFRLPRAAAASPRRS